MSYYYNTNAMGLNQFAFLRAFGRGFPSQIEPPTECFFNSMNKLQWKQWYREERINRRPEIWKDIVGMEESILKLSAELETF